MKSLKSIDHAIYDEYFFRDVNGSEEYYVFEKTKTLIKSRFGSRSGTFLDVGCGRGEMLLYLSQLGWMGTGTDCSPVAVNKAGELVAGRNVTVKQMTVTAMDLPQNSFDLVLFLNVWEHLNTEEVATFLQNLKRFIKKDGYLILQTSPTRLQSGFGKTVLRLFGLRPASEQWHINEQTLFSLKKSLYSAGFKGDIWLERMPKFWSSQVGRERGVLTLLSLGLDFLLDKTILKYAADSFPLRLFFGTDLWAVVRLSGPVK